MGNLFCCCIRDGGEKRKINVSPAIQTKQHDVAANRFVFAPATPYPPCIQYQKPVTIHNDVNLRKETLTLRPDPENPGQLLVSFSFDATVPGRITVVFFAEEDSEFNLTATKEDTLPPISFEFEKEGLGQKYIQPSGTGVDLSVFKDSELFKEEGGTCIIYPLAVKIEADLGEGESGSSSSSTNAQITQATFVKENGEVKISVVKQFLWVNGSRYELQDIYGIGDSSDQGKECVVCLSEPCDTIVLPCRHMCMCSGCAKALRFQKNECPVCRQPAERLVELEGNGNSNGDEHTVKPL